MLLFLKKFTALMVVITMLSSCAVYPVFIESRSPQQCKVLTKKVRLNFVAGDIVGNNCNGDACLVMLGVATGVFVSSVIISSSIYLVGNTVHYLEKQSRCDDELILEDKITKFSDTMNAVNGKRIELEALKQLQLQKLAEENKKMKALALESEEIDARLDSVEMELDKLDVERKELQSELKGLN